jgi:hypothetical protein
MVPGKFKLHFTIKYSHIVVKVLSYLKTTMELHSTESLCLEGNGYYPMKFKLLLVNWQRS